ncbi:MAG: FeoA domain-containing protein [Verrucomicrobiae bacterium]|nr:FeoA domain-containing protein [Verrucomicrobiae bacterium]
MQTTAGIREQDRILAEDTLKYLYHCEEQGQPATAEGLAAAEQIPGAQAQRILETLQQAGLATAQNARFNLTEAGRSYALQVIRAHRLYETYLAQETGYDEQRWHQRAHAKEHQLTPQQVNDLAGQLGHPRYDPHGDPIPTAEGRMPPLRGVSLLKWPTGKPALVTHVEDEPETVYAQLAALGVGPGIILRVLTADPQRLTLEIEGEQHVLAPLLAANVTVTEPTDELRGLIATPLSAQPSGQRCRVLRLSPRCRGAERRRLMDLGFVPGTTVEVELRGPFGDPTAYRVRDTLVALRREQANWVLVETL